MKTQTYATHFRYGTSPGTHTVDLPNSTLREAVLSMLTTEKLSARMIFNAKYMVLESEQERAELVDLLKSRRFKQHRSLPTMWEALCPVVCKSWTGKDCQQTQTTVIVFDIPERLGGHCHAHAEHLENTHYRLEGLRPARIPIKNVGGGF